MLFVNCLFTFLTVDSHFEMAFTTRANVLPCGAFIPDLSRGPRVHGQTPDLGNPIELMKGLVQLEVDGAPPGAL